MKLGWSPMTVALGLAISSPRLASSPFSDPAASRKAHFVNCHALRQSPKALLNKSARRLCSGVAELR